MSVHVPVTVPFFASRTAVQVPVNDVPLLFLALHVPDRLPCAAEDVSWRATCWASETADAPTESRHRRKSGLPSNRMSRIETTFEHRSGKMVRVWRILVG